MTPARRVCYRSGDHGFESTGNTWRLYVKGVPGLIKARGRFPVKPLDFRNMEIIKRDGCYCISICVEMPARITGGTTALKIRLDLIDEFASVTDADGVYDPGSKEQITSKSKVSHESATDTPDLGSDLRLRGRAWLDTGQRPAVPLDLGIDTLQSARDTHHKRGSWRWREMKRIAAKRSARQARKRREALHLWTTTIIRGAASIELTAPAIKANTKSGKGNAQNWGAAVSTVATLNRHVLSMAPAAAIQMLEYKSAEAGISFVTVQPDEHEIAVGRDLTATAKTARRAARILKKETVNV